MNLLFLIWVAIVLIISGAALLLAQRILRDLDAIDHDYAKDAEITKQDGA